MVHEVQDDSTSDDERQCLLKAPTTQPQQRISALANRNELTFILPALNKYMIHIQYCEVILRLEVFFC